MTEETVKKMTDKLAENPWYYEFLRDTANTLIAMAEVDPSVANKRRATNVCMELYKIAMGMEDKEALDSVTINWLKPTKYTNKES